MGKYAADELVTPTGSLNHVTQVPTSTNVETLYILCEGRNGIDLNSSLLAIFYIISKKVDRCQLLIRVVNKN